MSGFTLLRLPIRLSAVPLLLGGWLLSQSMQAQPAGGLAGLLPLTVDHRHLQSPVKSQAQRGTCIAFSVAAVLETFDGVPADLSEQGAYGYLKLQELGQGKVDAGGLLAHYPGLLAQAGFMHESVAPYEPKAALWSRTDSVLRQYLQEGRTSIADLVKQAGTTRYRVEPDQVLFLKDDQARDVQAIQRWLASGHRAVAVGYTHLYVPYWREYRKGVITPAEGFRFKVGEQSYAYGTARALRPRLADDVVAGRAQVELAHPKSPGDYGGHAVTVVGYTKDGFLIKNSWGRGWGQEGYAVVSFDYHRMFCDEALAVKEVSVAVQPGGVQARPVIWLKTRPTGVGANSRLRLSLFGPREGGLPAMRNVRYEVYEQDAAGGRGRLVEFPPPSVLTLTGTGYPVDVLPGGGAGGTRSDAKYWVQVWFASGSESQSRILTFPNVVWGNQEYVGH